MSGDFTPRLRQILLELLRADKAVSVKKLSENIGVSKRTVQRELEYIETPLKKYDLEFKSKTGIGVWLEGSSEAKETLYRALSEMETFDAGDRNERRRRLMLEMLKDKSPKKLFYYSQMFGVSEATISADIEAVSQWFERFHLKIIRRQGYGVLVDGSEKDYRQAVSAFVDENLNTLTIKEAYDDQCPAMGNALDEWENRSIYKILDDDILKRVVCCIMGLKDQRIMNLTENSYNGLVLHVTIAINRILKNEIIEDNAELVASLEKDSDYELAKYIANALEETFNIQIPPVEVAYICLHIEASKRQSVDLEKKTETLLENNSRIIELVSDMIDAYDIETAYVLKQDEEFIRGLMAHLQPTLVRLKNDMKIKNPVLSQIKSDYPEIFEKCKKVAEVIEHYVGRQLPESEIGFLAIHFGAALVRMENQKGSRRKVYVGVICASGIGISRLMANKLMRNFGDRIVLKTFAKGDLTPYVLENQDFFVSSIQNLADAGDVVYVSPLLVEKDMENIEKKVRQYEYTPKKREDNEFTGQLDKVHYFALQIKALIKDMLFFKVDNGITFDETLMAVSERLSPYNDRREMIQEDIRHRETLGTQVFPEFGFALLHSRTKGVVKPSFSICRTKDSASFTDPYFQNIKVIIVMLLPIDEHLKENSEMMGFLSETLIEDYFFLDTIMTKEAEEIREQLSLNLKKFFNQYLNRM